MNHIYKVIFNKVTGTFVAVSEFAKSGGKGSMSVSRSINRVTQRQLIAFTALASAMLLATGQAQATSGNEVIITNSAAINNIADLVYNHSGDKVNACYFDTVTSAVVCGDGSTNSQAFGVALGQGANAGSGNGAHVENIAIGNQAKTNSVRSIAIGAKAKVLSGNDGIAIGTGSEVGYTQAIAIGLGSKSIQQSTVALGHGSLADRAALTVTNNTDVSASGLTGDKVYGVGTDTDKNAIANTVKGNLGALSVGNAMATRQITNVAAGRDDSDAVNVAQLKAVAARAGAENYFHVNDTTTAQTGNATNKDVVNGIGGAKGIAALAAGLGAQATGEESAAVGHSATASGLNSNAFGHSAKSTNNKSLAVGYFSKAMTKEGNAIGFNASTGDGSSYEDDQTATGIQGQKAIALGSSTRALRSESLAIGKNVGAYGQQATVIGNDSTAHGGGSIVIGGNRMDFKTDDDTLEYAAGSGQATDISTLFINGITPTNAGVIATDGNGGQIYKSDGKGLTRDAKAVGESAAAYGTGAQAWGKGAIALGTAATAGYGTVKNYNIQNHNCMAKVCKDKATDKIIVGKDMLYDTQVVESGWSSMALGNGAFAKADRSTVVGTNSSALSTRDNVFGDDSVVESVADGYLQNGQNGNDGKKASTAVGNDNFVNSKDTFVLGNSVNTDSDGNQLKVYDADGNVVQENGKDKLARTIENSVYLGSNSQATAGNAIGTANTQKDGKVGTTTTAGDTGEVINATINDVTYGGFAGAKAAGAVTVGAAGTERRIQNLAAGEISKTSTDAINGSQLYAVAKGLKDYIDKGWNLQVNGGTSSGGSGSTGGSGSGGTGSTGTGTGQTTITPGDTVNIVQGNGVGITYSNDGATPDSKTKVTIGVNVDGTTTKIDSTNNQIVVATGSLSNNTTGAATSNTADGTIATVTNVASAINNSGFTAGNTNTDNLVTASTASTLINPGDKLTVEAGKNLSSSFDASTGLLQLSTKDDVDFNSVTVGKSLVVKPNANIDMGGNQIHNVAAGTAPTDAVNVSQLQGATQNLYNAIGDVRDGANAGTATGIATANLPQPHDPGKSMVSAGIGYYEGETALAVGLSSISDNGRWVIKGSLSVDTQSNAGIGAGVGYQW